MSTERLMELHSVKVNGTGKHQQVIPCPEMTFAYQPKNELPALTLNGHTLIHRGEVAVILASPGVGKTTLTEGLVASLIASKRNLSNVDAFGFTFNSTGKKVLLGDTERTQDDCSRTYHNMYKRLGKASSILSEDGHKIQDLTHLVMSEVGETEKLKKVLEQQVSTNDYEFIILDGILDFCLSMLDDKDATRVVKWVRALAVKYNCAIVVTIHPNKGTDNPAGHIGAFLYRWCRAFLLIRSTSDKAIKEITTDFQFAKLSHGNISGFDPVFFTWDESQAMMISSDGPAEPTYKIKFLKQAVMELRLQGANEMPSAVLRDHYSKLAGVKPDTGKKHLSKACEDGLLIPSGKGKATKYTPASDWNISTTQSGIVAPYIYTGAIPDSDSQYAKSPIDTRINTKGYPNSWD